MVHSLKWGSSFNTPAPRFCGVDFKDDSPADNSSAVNSDAWGGHANRHLAPSLEKPISQRSEEHTSELQSHLNLVCRLLLEKKKKQHTLSPRLYRPMQSADSA